MKTKSFKGYIEKRLTKKEIAQVEKDAQQEVAGFLNLSVSNQEDTTIDEQREERAVALFDESFKRIDDLEAHVKQFLHMMHDVERVMLKHEQALLRYKNDIAELQRKQKNVCVGQ